MMSGKGSAGERKPYGRKEPTRETKQRLIREHVEHALPSMSDDAIDDMLWFVQLYDLAAHQQEGQAISDKA